MEGGKKREVDWGILQVELIGFYIKRTGHLFK
jgi:hypothetical protein